MKIMKINIDSNSGYAKIKVDSSQSTLRGAGINKFYWVESVELFWLDVFPPRNYMKPVLKKRVYYCFKHKYL